MRRALAAVVITVLLGGAVVSRSDDRSTRSSRPPARAANASTQPAWFEPNVGQAGEGFEYLSRNANSTLMLDQGDAVLALNTGQGVTPVKMSFAGRSSPQALATGRLDGTSSYLRGDDPALWHQGVPWYQRVEYRSVYPGVDVVYYSPHNETQAWEFDVIVAPEVDPAVVSLSFDGAERVVVDGTGDLVVTTAGGDVRIRRPLLYQEVGSTRKSVDGRFRLDGGGRVGFDVSGRDPGLPLTIDPVVTTSTYLGGRGADNASSVAVDDQGNVYVTGHTGSANFPTARPFQGALAGPGGNEGNNDVFVAKLRPDGTGLVWATYFGGAGPDTGDAVAVGPDQSVYVAGTTESADFPLARAFQTASGGGPSDAFVAKLKADGTGIDYSSYLGGRSMDEARSIEVDPGGSAYVVGTTGSPNFPSVSALPLPVPPADQVDAFVAKVVPDGTGVQYSTRLGGTNDDQGGGVAIDTEGHAYVTGITRSPGFPTARPLQASPGGSATGGGTNPDVFVSKLAPAGSSLVFSTFLGGSEADQGAGIAVDADRNVYVTGTTRSANFPTASPVQGRNEGDLDAFVTKFNPEGATLVYSTYLGGSATDGGAAIAVDSGGNAVITGSTGSTNFPTARPIQPTNGGGLLDTFVTRLNPAGTVLLSSTYLGGRGDDQGSDLAVDKNGVAHVVGYTDSDNFASVKPFQPRIAGGVDAFVSAVSESGSGGLTTTVVRRSSKHDRRVRVLLGITLGLLLIALVQTLFLRRRESQWVDEEEAGEDEEEAGEDEEEAGEDEPEKEAEPAVTGEAGQADAESPPEPAPETAPQGEPAALSFADVDPFGADAAGLSFWDLFPEGRPPPVPESETGAGFGDPFGFPGTAAGDDEPASSRLSRLLRDWEHQFGEPLSVDVPDPSTVPPVPPAPPEPAAPPPAGPAPSTPAQDTEDDDDAGNDGFDDDGFDDDGFDDTDGNFGAGSDADEGDEDEISDGDAGDERRKRRKRSRRSGRRRRANPG